MPQGREGRKRSQEAEEKPRRGREEEGRGERDAAARDRRPSPSARAAGPRHRARHPAPHPDVHRSRRGRQAARRRALSQPLNCPTPVAAEGAPPGRVRQVPRLRPHRPRRARRRHRRRAGRRRGDQDRPDPRRPRRRRFRPFEGTTRGPDPRGRHARVEAQNALLKSLEEPPPATMFILLVGAGRAAADGAIALHAAAVRTVDQEETPSASDRDHEYGGGRGAHGRRRARRRQSSGQALALSTTTCRCSASWRWGCCRSGGAGRRTRVARPGGKRAPVGQLKKERTREDVAIVLRLMAPRCCATSRRSMPAPTARCSPIRCSPATWTRWLAPTRRSRARGVWRRRSRARRARRNASIKVVTEWLAVQV